jgi:hypothetical protein
MTHNVNAAISIIEDQAYAAAIVCAGLALLVLIFG